MTVQNLTDECLELYCRGKYKECLSNLSDEKLGGLDPQERLKGLLLAARIKRELDKLEEALALLLQAKELAATTGDDYLRLESELALNTVRAQLETDPEAVKFAIRTNENLINQVRRLQQGVRRDRLMISGLCELGLTKLFVPDLALAAQNFRLASGLAEEMFGANSVEMILPTLCLSIVHAMEGKHSLSLAMARSASQIARANFGKHPVLIHPMYRMAQAATRQKLFSLALQTCRQMEGLVLDYLGEKSVIYLDILAMKTAALIADVEFKAAEKTAARRLSLTEEMYKNDDWRLIDPLCDLAQIAARLGEKEKAQKCFERALKMVNELLQNPDFGGKPISAKDASAIPTVGTRLHRGSLCHLEYELIERLSDCYLWQGKLADVASLMPASMRTAHICRVDSVVSIIDGIKKHLEERVRNLDLPE